MIISKLKAKRADVIGYLYVPDYYGSRVLFTRNGHLWEYVEEFDVCIQPTKESFIKEFESQFESWLVEDDYWQEKRIFTDNNEATFDTVDRELMSFFLSRDVRLCEKDLHDRFGRENLDDILKLSVKFLSDPNQTVSVETINEVLEMRLSLCKRMINILDKEESVNIYLRSDEIEVARLVKLSYGKKLYDFEIKEKRCSSSVPTRCQLSCNKPRWHHDDILWRKCL